MMKGKPMTINQIREELEMLESNYAMAMDFKAYPLADHLLPQIHALQDKLIELICSEDPYTTEADVRFFEGFRPQ
jgi:hypothetical protein